MNEILSPEEFAKKMKEIKMECDIEDAHAEMDDLMCDVLIQLGYKDGVDVFNSTDKWYA